jgi:hypothetical protein
VPWWANDTELTAARPPLQAGSLSTPPCAELFALEALLEISQEGQKGRRTSRDLGFTLPPARGDASV